MIRGIRKVLGLEAEGGSGGRRSLPPLPLIVPSRKLPV